MQPALKIPLGEGGSSLWAVTAQGVRFASYRDKSGQQGPHEEMELPGGSGRDQLLQLEGGRDASRQAPSPRGHRFASSIPSALQVLVPSCHQAVLAGHRGQVGGRYQREQPALGAGAVRARGEDAWQRSPGGGGWPGHTRVMRIATPGVSRHGSTPRKSCGVQRWL